jgi:hypothetical protein
MWCMIYIIYWLVKQLPKFYFNPIHIHSGMPLD